MDVSYPNMGHIMYSNDIYNIYYEMNSFFKHFCVLFYCIQYTFDHYNCDLG